MSLREALDRHRGLLLALLLCGFHFASFDITRQAILTDVRYFLYFAGQVAHGAVPHLDYFENKTQLATYVGALLHAIGEGVGVEPLMAIRLGYLTLAALAALAGFFVFRPLGSSPAVAGGLALAAHCSFGLLGLLPSIGNIPKLLMALAASAAALAAYRKAWFLAGVAGSLAFMDWQIGGLVGLAVLATAAAHGRPRLPALLRVTAGGAAGLAPFVLYYLVHGALAETVRQVVGATLFRGQTALAHDGLTGRLANIARVAELACPGQQWLFYLGLAGIPVMLWWAWRWRHDARARLLHPLVIYHLGVVAFTLTDFQYYGDFFLLLHSVAFFLGVLWVMLYEVATGFAGSSRRALVAGVLLALVLVAARPGLLRPRLQLVTKLGARSVTLEDQRQVASAVNRRVGDGSLAMLEHSELLVLMPRRNALPLVYCNLPVWHRYREDAGESWGGTCIRLLLGAETDALVPPKIVGYDPLLRRGYTVESFASDNDRYSVAVAFRRSGKAAEALTDR